MHEKFEALNCDWHMPEMIGVSDECMDLLNEFEPIIEKVNVYDIFGVCWGAGPYPQLTVDEDGQEQMETSAAFPHLYKSGKSRSQTHKHKTMTAADYTPWAVHRAGPKDKKKLQELPPCTFGSGLLDYMNSDAVREAMHIPDYVQAWDLCTEDITYVSEPEASQWIYEELAGKIRMLHYSGDTDGSVPTAGTQAWIASLGWDKTSEWKQYMVHGQVAGYHESYVGGLTFGTVHGAGHMAPQFKPPQTYHLVFNWLFEREI